jgi:hypothetical protein
MMVLAGLGVKPLDVGALPHERTIASGPVGYGFSNTPWASTGTLVAPGMVRWWSTLIARPPER